MNKLDEDLDDSALFCKSLIQKRKATGNGNPKNSKQLKLDFSQSSSKTEHLDQEKQISRANSSGGKTRPTASRSSNSKLDESISSYFSVKTSVNTCPLCLKSFKSDSAYSGHMKQCAKTHKMTTQQLLGALELQKKQMQERRNMGLCSQKVLSPPKTISKKKREKDAEQYDLALGLALSRSLSSTSKPTLEEFGFTSKNAPVGPSRRKNDAARKTILRERTAEERQRIIIEKVALVLLDEKEESKSINQKCSQSLNSQVPQLWNMGENNERRGWYVEGIKTLVRMEEENAEKIEENTQSNGISNNIDAEISKLNLPRKDIHKDWSKMINNSKLSDFIAKTKDCQDVHLHSLVLLVRCPELLEKDCRTVFGKFNLSTIIAFLEFVYCGTLNGLTRVEMNELFDLAVELNYDELITVLNCLKDSLVAGDGCDEIANSPPKAEIIENEVKHPSDKQTNEIESKKAAVSEDRDLFTEDDVVDLTQNDSEDEGNESNAEKSYWSFIQHEKNKLKEAEKIPNGFDESMRLDEEGTNSKNADKQLQRILSDDSTTRDLDDESRKADNKMSSDCIILSSGSDSKTQENLAKTPGRTPSPVNVHYEVPEFDPYDNFNFFSEEQISPVGLHSQSLITGDISMESLKSSDAGQETAGRVDDFETKKPVGYCSTPVTVHEPGKVKRVKSQERRSRKGKMRDLSASRILRKSLGLQQKRRISNSAKKTNVKRRDSKRERDFTEALTNTILHELSKSSAFESSPVPSSRRNMFLEMTPISGRDEFVDNVTPSPNYSNMGESLIKEQLTKYGLKKNLAKSKAKKILKYIYEELHPLYNTETGKIVKKICNTPKVGKKTKPKSKANPKKSRSEATGKTKRGTTQKNSHNSSKESEEMSGESMDGLTEYDSDESEFEDLSETLTQSTPCNPVDLASAFFDFLQFNPDYHQKILLYEPIWLEDLQRKLKEAFKKHFKIADLMDFLDQKCISFRSEAQARNVQRRNEKKKEKMKKRKNSS